MNSLICANYKLHMKRYILSLFVLAACGTMYGQTIDDKYSKDVASIDAIINAYYDVVSGPATAPWEFERDKFIHSPDALIVKIDTDGKVDAHSLEGEYVPILLQPRGDFYEVELSRITQRYENMAQVWSTYEIRSDPDDPSGVRGISSIMLYYSEGRWWIASWISQPETKNPIPVKYLGK